MSKLQKYFVNPALFAAVCLIPGIGIHALQAQTTTVVNAASFTPSAVAPGSIVTIFGSKLTTVTAAVTDPAHPPTTLGGTGVQIGGAAAGLFFVSPGQINAVVPATAALGNAAVLITSPSGTVSGTVTVSATAAPGLFSLVGGGIHSGAIIDALTGRVGAFSVTTQSKTTFLSLYLTGANFTAPPVVLIGGVAATVTFAGASPCCAGLQQINVSLPASLAGAGRVPVVVQAAGQASNVVEIVLLPNKGEGAFSDEKENEDRHRELSVIASIPGTSLALVADENDDVIRQLDVVARKVVATIALPDKAEPSAIAVNASGTLAFVAERGLGRVAVIDLVTRSVAREITVGAGPVALAISGNKVLAVNGDANSVTIFDMTSFAVTATVPVGSGPRGAAADAAGHAWVTNQNDGTVSLVDLNLGTVVTTTDLGPTMRPAAIQLISGTPFAVIADPVTSSDGKVLVVNLVSGGVTSFSVNALKNGGAGDIVLVGTTAYIATQTGGVVSVLNLSLTGVVPTGSVTTVKTGPGLRSLAFDAKDSLLLGVNESGGMVVLISVPSNTVQGTIRAVVSESGEDSNDHSDHDNAGNMPKVTSVTPAVARRNSTINLVVVGTGLRGVTNLVFALPSGVADSAITVTNVDAATNGKQLTATVNIGAAAATGVRTVRIGTMNGTSSMGMSSAVFTVIP